MVSIRNTGIFELKLSFISEETELLVEIFSRLKVVPVRCEVLCLRKVIRYEAISEHFVENPLYSKSPEYDINILRDEHGNLIDVEFIPKLAVPGTHCFLKSDNKK